MTFSLITIIICASYLIESVFGFGGTIIALSLLGIFFDFKEVIPVVIYASVVSSAVIFLSDRKSIDVQLLKRVFPYVAVGTILGAYLFYVVPSDILLKIFALFIFYHAVKSLFFSDSQIVGGMKKIILVLSGVVHGMFGTGGPIALIAVKNDFADKSQLRTTMAIFFIMFNIIRVLQLHFFTDFPVVEIFKMWWLIVPLSISILIGYKIHLSVNDKVFNKAVSILLLFTAIIFLAK